MPLVGKIQNSFSDSFHLHINNSYLSCSNLHSILINSFIIILILHLNSLASFSLLNPRHLLTSAKFPCIIFFITIYKYLLMVLYPLDCITPLILHWVAPHIRPPGCRHLELHSDIFKYSIFPIYRVVPCIHSRIYSSY